VAESVKLFKIMLSKISTFNLHLSKNYF